MTVERKAVRRNLMELIDFGYNIEYSESVRVNKNGSEDTVYTDWYLEKDFSDATEFWFKKVVEDQDKYYKNLYEKTHNSNQHSKGTATKFKNKFKKMLEFLNKDQMREKRVLKNTVFCNAYSKKGCVSLSDAGLQEIQKANVKLEKIIKSVKYNDEIIIFTCGQIYDVLLEKWKDNQSNGLVYKDKEDKYIQKRSFKASVVDPNRADVTVYEIFHPSYPHRREIVL